MVTEACDHAAISTALDSTDWSVALAAVNDAERWLCRATPGDSGADTIVTSLVRLATHSKWEIRRAVANVAAQVRHPAFESAIVKLAVDDNTRVRQAAERAALRRRDWHHASMLGRQHEDRINATLDDIEMRFGVRGRDAVKRASEQIANTFARELYHEVIKLLSPLATSVEGFQELVASQNMGSPELAHEAGRIGRRVAHLRAVLDSMRAYTEQPKLIFTRENLRDVIEDAVSLVREAEWNKSGPAISIDIDATVVAELARSRFVQAITNVLINAVESYEGVELLGAVRVRAHAQDGHVAISIEDSGCGMSDEVLADAVVLFATRKPNGTGFGLPLAIKIIESEHGGRLTLDSVKGRGTTVRVVVPAHRPGDRQ